MPRVRETLKQNKTKQSSTGAYWAENGQYRTTGVTPDCPSQQGNGLSVCPGQPDLRFPSLAPGSPILTDFSELEQRTHFPFSKTEV